MASPTLGTFIHGVSAYGTAILLKRFVAADVGIGFIVRSNVIEDVKAGALAAIPLADALIHRDLALVYRKNKALSRAALAFIEIAVKLKAAHAIST